MQEMTNRELQLFSLEILKDVHNFCVKENIKYSLAYGTLIGAVRHKGFIPWDNDIDICMPRPDYERFIKSYKSENFELAFFGEGCKHDCLIAYARVFDNKKTYATKMHWIKNDVGVWIDVFPLDGVPENFEEFVMLYNDLSESWNAIIPKKIQYEKISHYDGLKAKLKLLAKKVMQLNGFGGHKLQKAYINKIKKISFDSAIFWSQLAVMDNGPVEHISKNAFSELSLMNFEDSSFCVMKDFDVALKAVYGDYMQLPPEEDRIPHQSFIKFFWK